MVLSSGLPRWAETVWFRHKQLDESPLLENQINTRPVTGGVSAQTELVGLSSWIPYTVWEPELFAQVRVEELHTSLFFPHHPQFYEKTPNTLFKDAQCDS